MPALEQPLDLVKMYLDSTVTVRLKGGRHITGKLHGFDAHLNLVLGDALEVKEATDDNNSSTNDDSNNSSRHFPMLFIRGDSVILVSPVNSNK
jgi:U6 snRNA-associated Sm-like protein LSm3